LVLLPKNEVAHARRHHPNVALFIVYAIKLSKGHAPTATGGERRVFYPWNVDAGELASVDGQNRPYVDVS